LLFHRACEVLGISPDQAVMIGDNPDTDIKGARALGMGAVLIGAQGDISTLDLRLPPVRAVAFQRP
jgi:FMN phosphatase YigB (HAD superfamily)